MRIKLCFLLLSILFVSAYRDFKHKEMEHRKAQYIKRRSKAWRKGGRLIGEIKNPPETFTIKIKHAGSSKVIYTYTHPAQLTIYQTRRLPAGRYNLLIEAKGYSPYSINNIKIKTRMDCMIKLIFGTRVYHND